MNTKANLPRKKLEAETEMEKFPMPWRQDDDELSWKAAILETKRERGLH